MNTFLVDSFWTEPPTTEEAPTRPVTSGKSKQKPEYPKEEEFVFRRSYPSFIWFIFWISASYSVWRGPPTQALAATFPRRAPLTFGNLQHRVPQVETELHHAQVSE